MPTAKERIEELKKQVKNEPENFDLQAKAAAEIIAIRNACRIERKTSYGLDKQIPPAPDGKMLSNEVSKMTNDDECDSILRDEATRKDLLASGHGGKMAENVRKKYGTEVDAQRKAPGTEAILKRNTVGGRIAELSAEARELSLQLASTNTKLRSEALERSVSVLGEYTTLAAQAKKPHWKGLEAPWKAVDSVVESARTDKTALEMVKTPEKASAMLNVIATGDVLAFQSKFKQEMAAQAASKAPTVPVKQQPGRIQEEAQAGQGNNPEGPKAPTA